MMTIRLWASLAACWIATPPMPVASNGGGGVIDGSGGAYSPERAADYAADHVYPATAEHPHGKGQCATKVRLAVEAGIGHAIPARDLPPLRKGPNPRTGIYEETRWARDYGLTFEKVGLLKEITVEASMGNSPTGYTPQIGDVVVIEPTSDPKHPEGHTAIYTREGWVSDYKQGSDFYPNARYRREKPAYTIYRRPNS